MIRYIPLFFLLILLVSCEEEIFVPKPPSYLRLDLPDHTYTEFKDDCPYTLSIAELFTVKPIPAAPDPNSEQITTGCHKDIDLGALNGTIHLSYIEMIEPLSDYVNFVNDKIGEHKVMASGIRDWKILVPESRVYCTFFELQGDVAAPFQFYITDSVSHFMSGVVYFNSVPNYDSLKPSLDYLKLDLEHMVNTLKWKE